MRLRLLISVPSDHPDFPFQAGQIIRLPRLTMVQRQWLKDGKAEVLPDDESELAALGAGKTRGSR